MKPMRVPLDLMIAVMLMAIGLVIMTSASLEVSVRDAGDALFYLKRQLWYVLLGGALMGLLAHIPLRVHQRLAPIYMIGTLCLLVLVLIPGIGQTVNHSTRWLEIGSFQFQPSELAKPALILWMAAYMVNHVDRLQQSMRGMGVLLAVTAVVSLLLILEPDYGTACVWVVTALGMIFLGGGHLRSLLGYGAFAVITMGGFAAAAPYRLTRIQAFLDPWADPFNSGYQLTQSLIAIGSGGMFGQGLGEGIQKHFYLPEVHTDFVFAVAAEELGLLGVTAIIVLFGLFLFATLRTAYQAQAVDHYFAAVITYGIGLWISLQAFVNIAVNMGALPTKGLTLPFMSAGGSSLIATLIGMGLLWRVHREIDAPASGVRRRKPRTI